MLDKLASPFYLDKHMSEELVAVTTAVTITHGASINEIVQRARLVDECYKRIMKKDVHFGVIPGTFGKPSLLKAGAEKLLSLFNLGATEPTIKERELPEGHREYLITINITHYPTSRLVGTGVGLCSTMEKKYRYRNVADFEILEDPIPKDAKEKTKEYRKQGLGMKKIEGKWEWVRYTDSTEASENPDIADVYNTVLKMAHKRALVSAALVVTGASDIFTQDVEDFSDYKPAVEEPEQPKAPAGRQYELKEVDIWHVEVKDVIEKKGKDGTVYFQVELDDGRKLFTSNGDLAKDAAETEGTVHLEVRPGRRADSWVLAKILEEPVEA
jgi:hypothetical protein